MKHSTRRHRFAAALAVASLIVNPTTPLVQAGQVQPAKAAHATQSPVKSQPAAAREAVAPAAAPIDGGWPRLYNLPSGGSILVYQPQVSSWENQTKLLAYSGVAYHAAGAEKPTFGTIKLEADTKVSVTERLVSFQNLKIAEVNFQTLNKDQVREITAEIDKAIPVDERVIALDRVLANLDKSQIVPKNAEGIKTDPPTIFFSKTPAVLVNLDGDPIWSPIKDNNLKFAVNTNWDLFQDTGSGALYLRNNDTWLTAADLKGPWTPAGTLPDSFTKLPADDNWTDVRVNLPGKHLAATAVPHVFVSTQPAELILLTGEPAYSPVPKTGLEWVSNTESDLFRVGKTGAVYYLVSGRWFSATDFAGPWTFATPSLPADFQQIPLEHPRSRVLASVPGTSQAAEAVLLAQIPQTARVNRKEAKAPEVAYQGEPQFVPIEQTNVQRAVNTDKDIFKVGGSYYLCYRGVWFVAGAPSGPWDVAVSVPPDIYKIPASDPANNVTYVTVEESNDEWVDFAAAAGYTGMMVGWGCAMWGSGWYYPPYYGWYGGYPYYYPYFPSYGASAWYNPWTGAYGRSASVYGPYGGAGIAARYNPRTGTYARGAAVYGPGGARGVAQAYNPRTGTYAATRQGSNVYGSWGSTAVQRGDDWAKTNRYTSRRTGDTTRTIKTGEGGALTHRGTAGTIGVGSGGNIYAGNDGNVYRRENGTWQKYDNGSWSNTDRQPNARPTPREGQSSVGTLDKKTRDQLNRDSSARRDGAQRTKDLGSYRGGSSNRGAGSYRPSGGARMGGARGGGRRR